jgi:hypothetical protein
MSVFRHGEGFVKIWRTWRHDQILVTSYVRSASLTGMMTWKIEIVKISKIEKCWKISFKKQRVIQKEICACRKKKLAQNFKERRWKCCWCRFMQRDSWSRQHDTVPEHWLNRRPTCSPAPSLASASDIFLRKRYSGGQNINGRYLPN